MTQAFHAPRFGTDGIRGEAGTPPLDRDTLRRVGAALGIWLQRAGPERKRVVLAHDGRASAGWIRDALVQGLAISEASATDLGLSTTPALAFVTRTEPFVLGIMISASHNPASDNGIKIFGGEGTKLPDDDERAIERLTVEVDPKDAAVVRPRFETRPELLNRYQEFLANAFSHLDLSGRRIVVDAAHGGGSELAPAVLAGLGAEVVAVGCQPTGDNINDGVGAMHAANLVETVRNEGALLGVCLDGDGDRSIFVDDSATVRDGDETMAVLARELRARGELPNDTLVATVMSNLGLHKALERHGIAVHTTPVGDRAVVQAMRKHGFGLGGEQSGHIIFGGDGHFAGDGLFTALKLLAVPAVAEVGTSPLFGDFQTYPQVLLNVPVSHKPELDGLPDVVAAVARVEEELGSDGRVLLRYSGTENLCRVMVEGPEEDVVQRHAESIAVSVRESLS